jgi:hypothetical protein
MLNASYVLVMLKYNARFIFKCVFMVGSGLSEMHPPTQ